MLGMSIIRDILRELLRIELNYKGIKVNIFGVPKLSNYKKTTISSTLQRLHDRGLVTKNRYGWRPSGKARSFLEIEHADILASPFEKKAPKNLIVMFDIPQDKRYCRDWLRTQLKEFDYMMIQQSVWVGPSPLPQKFKELIFDLEIKDCIKTFKLAKGYNL